MIAGNAAISALEGQAAWLGVGLLAAVWQRVLVPDVIANYAVISALRKPEPNMALELPAACSREAGRQTSSHLQCMQLQWTAGQCNAVADLLMHA